jgi:type I restriction-modification system DNA methylase subunit
MNNQQKEIIKLIRHFTYRKDALTVFCDAVEYLALKTALGTDIYNSVSRAARMEAILSSYDTSDLALFNTICHELVQMLSLMTYAFNDYLGELYMELDAGKKRLGQFFTPMSVSRLMAKLNFLDAEFTKPMTTINEPACGSGGLLMAVLEELMAQGVNYSERVFIVANDIDRRCVNMCYLQLSFAGAAAMVVQQDTITQRILGETFITPAYALQYRKFNRIKRGLSQSPPAQLSTGGSDGNSD